MAFQSSVNDMASSLTTLEQIKFNEALYILKTFGVEAEGDQNELNALAKLLEGKKVPEILEKIKNSKCEDMRDGVMSFNKNEKYMEYINLYKKLLNV